MSVKRQITYDLEVLDAISRASNKLAKAVTVTLGARGRNVLIESETGEDLRITKDGVTVARNVKLENQLENVICRLIKEASLNTNEEAGDGTSTCVVLTNAIIQEGLKRVKEGVNPIFLKRSMDKVLPQIISYLEGIAIPVSASEESIEQIATISANNDAEIGMLIAKAFRMVGKTGVVRIDENTVPKHDIEYTEGMQFDRGWLDLIFSYKGTSVQNVIEYKNPYILVCDFDIQNLEMFGTDEGGNITFLDEIADAKRPLLIICDNMDSAPAQVLAMNSMDPRNEFRCMVVKAPEFGQRRLDELEDIATMTGATFISASKGNTLKELTMEDLGQASLISVTEHNTSIVEGAGNTETVKQRAQLIADKLEVEEDEYTTTILQERIAKLTSGVATIKLGAMSEIELKEIRDRVEDALNATRAAMEEGILPGGGVALYNASLMAPLNGDNNQTDGREIIHEALKYPITKILENAGLVVADVLNRINQAEDSVTLGYDVKGDKFGDMITMGIVDPLKITKTALKNAVSVAGTLLTTQCVINNEEVQDEVPRII